MAIFDSLGKYRNTGLLILRLGIGTMMIIHGFPKLAGGPALWEGVGGSMKLIGIDFLPTFWGFMAAASEAIGGFLLILGLFFRPVNLLLIFTMVIAILVHFNTPKQGLNEALHPMELAILFLSLLFIGPGKYSIDKR
jgi:putative oxidoreductase